MQVVLKGAKRVLFGFKGNEPKYDFSVLRMRNGFIGGVGFKDSILESIGL